MGAPLCGQIFSPQFASFASKRFKSAPAPGFPDFSHKIPLFYVKPELRNGKGGTGRKGWHGRPARLVGPLARRNGHPLRHPWGARFCSRPPFLAPRVFSCVSCVSWLSPSEFGLKHPAPIIHATTCASASYSLIRENSCPSCQPLLAANAFLKINAGKVTDPLAANNPVFRIPAILLLE